MTGPPVRGSGTPADPADEPVQLRRNGDEMRPETTNADWFCDRFFAETRSGFGFDAMWRDYAKHLTVPDLRAAARILKIEKPAKTRDALREQFAVVWRVEGDTQ